MCKARQRVVCVARDGSKREVHRCANMRCLFFTKEVGDECDTCQHAIVPTTFKRTVEPAIGKARLLDDGTLVVEKVGWEPPAVPKGYRRKSNDLRSEDAWVFLSEYPACPKRQLLLDQAPCGKLDVKAICRDGVRLVNLETCRKCIAAQ